MLNRTAATEHAFVTGVHRSPLGQVIGDLLQAATDLANDPMSAAVGFHPDPTPTLIRTAREQGWTFAAIERELERRGISERWQYDNGIGSIIWDEEGPDGQAAMQHFAEGI